MVGLMERQMTEEQKVQLATLAQEQRAVMRSFNIRYYCLTAFFLLIGNLINEFYVNSLMFMVFVGISSIVLSISHCHSKFKDRFDELKDKFDKIVSQ